MTNAESPRPLKVFLSHAHADADVVRALYDRLVADGIDAWLDKEKLIPGQDWEREIRKAVREADVVIVCLSKQFNQRGYRQKEVRIALDEAEMMPEGEIFIIPARLEECENLESLRKWHWVDLFEKDSYDKLIQSLLWRAKNVEAQLEPKKNPITGVFRKPIVKRQSNSEAAEPYRQKQKNNNALSLFEKTKKLIKGDIKKWIIGIFIILFAYFVSFVVPSWISKAGFSYQEAPTKTKEVVPTLAGTKIWATPSLTKTLTSSITVTPSITPTTTSSRIPTNSPTVTLTYTPGPSPTPRPPCLDSKISGIAEEDTELGTYITVSCSDKTEYTLPAIHEGVYKIGPNGIFFVFVTFSGDVFINRVGNKTWFSLGDVRHFHIFTMNMDTLFFSDDPKLTLRINGDHPYSVTITEGYYNESATLSIPRSLTYE